MFRCWEVRFASSIRTRAVSIVYPSAWTNKLRSIRRQTALLICVLIEVVTRAAAHTEQKASELDADIQSAQ